MLVVLSDTRAQQGQITTGINEGAKSLRIAVPEFKPKSADPKLAALAKRKPAQLQRILGLAQL